MPDTALELRCERRWWRRWATLTPRRWHTRRVPRSTAERRRRDLRTGLVIGVLCALCVVAAGIGLAQYGAAGFYAGPLLVLLLLVLSVLLLALSGFWYAMGAGQPMLRVCGDELRVRLRFVPPDAASAGPTLPDWWDVTLPLDTVTGIRIARGDKRAGRWLIAVDLPADVADELRGRGELTKYTAWFTRVAGSPVAVMAGAMLPPGHRRQRLPGLVAELERRRARVTER
ncbi:MAG: hypothetical protein WCA46_19235 [Actinocatenispora sp.]